MEKTNGEGRDTLDQQSISRGPTRLQAHSQEETLSSLILFSATTSTGLSAPEVTGMVESDIVFGLVEVSLFGIACELEIDCVVGEERLLMRRDSSD